MGEEEEREKKAKALMMEEISEAAAGGGALEEAELGTVSKNIESWTTSFENRLKLAVF